MEMQQIFGQRLERLLSEKRISQGEFAEAVCCSRQSINFYILGKRNPDIALAGKNGRVFRGFVRLFGRTQRYS